MLLNHFTAFVAAVFIAPFASAAVVDFNDISTTTLPYTEKGLTFTDIGGNNSIVAGGVDGHLTAGTNIAPIRIRVTGVQPFDLESLVIENLFRSWSIQASTGATVTPISTGTLDFTGLTGWTNLSSFELIHDPGEANGTIRVDDITFTLVPEPATASLLLAGSMLGLVRRRQLTSGRS